MRLAVGLPSLDAGDPLRGALDDTFAALVDDGHQVEGFAEHDRTRETLSFPVYHYLRMSERHSAAAFDAALYPLGRDATPYQGIYSLMHRFPGVVWFLDPIVHHLAVGGIALMHDWFSYRELLDAAYGDRGAAVAQTVAYNWGTGALFRRYDLVAATAATQPHVLAAWPALARRIASRLADDREVGVVPIPAPEAASSSAARLDAVEVSSPVPRAARVAVMTVNESYATSAVRVAAAVLETGDEATVTVCTSEPIYKAEGRRVSEHLGIHDRIEWCLTSSPRRLAEAAAAADVLVWLAEELQGGHRLLLLQGLAAGKLTVTPRCALYDDLPAGVVAKVDLGHTVGAEVGGLLRSLQDDEALRDGLSRAARSFAAEQATPSQAARRLAEELEAARRGSTLRREPVAGRTWSEVRAGIVDAALPGGSSPELRRRLERIVGSHTEGLGR